MERLVIIMAVLASLAAGVAVLAMAARSRRPPLRMAGELDPADEHLVLDTVGAPDSPIDRSAPVLDAWVADRQPLAGPEGPERARQIEAPGRRPGSGAGAPVTGTAAGPAEDGAPRPGPETASGHRPGDREPGR